MNWKFFVGACIVVCAALLPFAPPVALAGGVLVAGVVNWRLAAGRATRA